MALGIIAAAVGTADMPAGEGRKIVIPDHKLFLVPCESEEEADFVAGMLNSSVINLLVASYAVSTGISTHILSRVPLPKFRNEDSTHRDIATSAKAIRKILASEKHTSVEVSKLNLAVGRLLGLDPATVNYTVSALKDFGIQG